MLPQNDVLLTEELFLRPIRPEDHLQHLRLMHRIYPPAFAYLWPDEGAWYINHIHTATALQQDLAVPDAPYYHVYFQENLIGIFRLKLAAPNPDFPENKRDNTERQVQQDPAVER
ncbi:MAG: hypothetical protein AAF840_16555 [Bacteroidota bacterium]